VANKKFQSNAQGGKKLSNFFNRFYTLFSLFHTFFQIFRNFSTTFDVFKHELARLVLPHLVHLAYSNFTPRSAAISLKMLNHK
jgi:hypothetical protein